MIAAIFLLGGGLFGIGLMERTLGSRLSRLEHLFFGSVVGFAVTTAATFAITRMAGHLSSQTVLVVMGAIWLVSLYFWLPFLQRRRERANPSVGNTKISWPWQLIVLLCLLAPLYFVLFRSHMFQAGPDGGLYSGGASAAYDVAFHTALTTSFVYGDNFPPLYPAMPPAPLLYPCLPDFQTAILMSLGLSLQTALIWTGVLLALALTAVFYLFALSLVRLQPTADSVQVLGTRSRWSAALATLLFVLNGGFGFLYFLGDWWTSREGVPGSWTPFQTNYTNMAERGVVWPNLITDILLSQRTTLFGLALTLIIFRLFALVWRDFDEAGKQSSWSRRRALLVAGLLAGLLPGFHPHSFVAVGIVSGFLFLLRPRRDWLAFWLPALLLATPYLTALIPHASAPGFLRFQPGWRGQGEPSWIVFWIRNVGLPALLIIPAWLASGSALRRFYLPFLGLLALSLFIVFSPNDYDNLKLIYYWYAPTVVVLAAWLVRLAGRNRAGAIFAIVSIVISIASGGLALAYELQSHRLVFDRGEIAAAEFVRAQTAPHSLFLTAPTFYQPVLSLAGRAVVRGPTAWLWSHGYPFAEREADVRAIYSGRGDSLDLLRYYHVDYIYLGARERQELKANQDFFDGSFPLLYRNGDIRIYDARPAGQTALPDRAPYPVREFASRVGLDPYQPLVEFSAIGFPLYRELKGMLGRPPRYQEFMDTLRTVGRGVYPGAHEWRTVLETNQRKLAESWATKPEFRGTGTSEKSPAADYNAAYVLLHFFGYLRRDIDTSVEGYEFWLGNLNRTRDYRSLTRAFIESEEYKSKTP
jgi:hypothetical protein